MSQCCCSRIKDCFEPTIINDAVHEPLGPKENFCGPFDKHAIRDLNASLRASEEKLKVAAIELEHIAFGYAQGDKYLTKNMSARELANTAKVALSLISNPALLQLAEAREKVVEAAMSVYMAMGFVGANTSFTELSDVCAKYAALKAVTEKR